MNSAATTEQAFAAALATPPADRTRFLAEHCPDPETRLEVAELLAFDSRAEAAEFLPPASATQPGRPVHAVGPYLLREELGRGGRGTVYRAERVGDFRKEVAVMLGPPGSTTPTSPACSTAGPPPTAARTS